VRCRPRVQHAVVGFADDGIDGADLFIPFLCQGILYQSVDGGRHAQSIGQYDRRFKVAQLLHLTIAGELAEAVAEIDGGGDLFLENISRVGQDGRHARAHIRPACHRGMPYEHAFHVGNGIELSGRQYADADA
jgi:hypothetical protein